MKKDKYFPDFVGQQSVKSQLGFYIDCYQDSDYLPHLLFAGEKGSGKTEFAKQTARNLKKRQVLVNCTTLRTIPDLLGEVLDPYQSLPTTIIFDECHGLGRDVQKALLTIIGGDGEKYTSYAFSNRNNDWQINIDFTKLSFIFATTDKQKVNTALCSRLEHIAMEPYGMPDIKRIIGRRCYDIDFDKSDKVLDAIASLSRGNARDASIKLAANKIIPYCRQKSIKKFNLSDYHEIKSIFGIYELGLNSLEFTILNYLYESKEGCSLTALQSKTGLDRAAQQDAEKYLLKLNLLDIFSGKRYLTKDGRKYIINNR